MKTIQISSIVIILALILTIPGILKAQKKVEKVLANREFKVADFASLEIEHKYGEIVCKNHDINVIKIKVTAKLETSDPGKAENVFSRIALQISGDDSKVKIKSDFSNKILSKNENLSIDIEVFMPENINVTLDHMFGNAVVGNLAGVASLSSSYGSIKTGNLSHSKNDIKVSFGSGTIGTINGGKIKVSYGDLVIEKAETIQLTSEYSNTRISSAKSMVVQNEGGSFKAGAVETIELATKFGDAEIENLGQSILVKNEYGSLKVNNIGAEFTSVDVDNSFGSAELNFHKDASFAFEARMSFCDLKYPEKSANMSEKITTAFESNYKGKIGTASSNSRAVIKSSYGGVDIKLNK